MRAKLTMHVAAVAAIVGLGATQALAGCFENVGCPNDHNIPKSQLRQLGCEPLWTVRNAIYDDNGYCFKTAHAKAVFSNQGCSYQEQASVPLNAYERTNVSRIVSVEREKGCP